MPIRINLLAELQAAEEERRKDPVKRGVMVAAVIVSLVAAYAATLQVKVMAASRKLGSLETKWKAIEKNYETAVAIKRRNGEAEEKLTALREMSTNRFLWGNALNAFQQSVNNIDDVQVTRFRVDQSYTLTEPTPSRTNGTTIVRGKPGASTEKIVVLIEGMDSGTPPGSRVTGFKDAIANQAYFQQNLARTNGVRLTSRSAPQADASGALFVTFTLECAFPEKVR